MNRAHWPRYAAAVVGFAWFLQIGGGPALNPRNLLWLMAGDWLQHWLGWQYFAHEPWAFPLGRIGGLLYPVGTNIGFTDSNPLVSLTLKPFAAFLPKYVQFIGPWLAACFVLQGYFGAALASVVTRRPWQQFLGGCLFALSPVLAARLGHDTLCAHWLILGLLYLGLRECRDGTAARRTAWLAAGAATLSAAIHPYLAVICWVLAGAVFVRLWRTGHAGLARALGAAGTATAGVLAVFGLIGYFGAAQLSGSGFGDYSSNLLTFVNPAEHSRLLPAIKVPEEQWEGFGFLGAGGLVLAALAGIEWCRRRPSTWRRHWPVLAASALMALYAVSTVLTVGQREVFRLDSLTPFGTPFRASGRFIWPLHYLLLAFGVWGAARLSAGGRRAPAVATAVLACAVTLQAADLKVDSYWLGAKAFRPAPISNLKLAVGHYRHVALFPMQVLGVCGGEYDLDRTYRYMYLAYRLNSTYNSGIFARLPRTRVLAECRRLIFAVESGRLDPDTVYVLQEESLPLFERVQAGCGRFGEDWICVSRESNDAFRRYLTENRPSPAR